ncbi:uncharacterized protein [Arachis hypogaea]|uniref:uncharacterized protein n=1 Tax=Arachis hypogaea TaxID=3818 RepID=UPI003B211475
MIIPKEKIPKNNIDVYLQPLIKELKELWHDGVQILDRFKNEMFTLRAALMWTISDFSGLGNLSGWNMHYKYACPTCYFNTDSYRLKHDGKWCFLGHCHFLERGHKFRLSRTKFNGKHELRDSPATLTGSEILDQLEGINVSFGKELQTSKDVMHIEKNVFDNVLYTLLNETGRSKDNLKARKDLKEMDKVTAVLIELSSFFQWLCSKSLSLTELEKLQPRIILTLCHLEMLFPSSFFTIMVHLTCHLVDEVKLGGPVHYRWMYLGHLKSYVRNKAKSEGSIAEGYVAEEALTFCSRYLEGIVIRFNRPPRVNDRPDGNYSTHVDSLFPQMGNSKGAFTVFELSPMEKKQVHRYVVLNCPYVKPFIDYFKDFVRRQSKGRRPSNIDIEKRVNKNFDTWFPTQLMNPDIINTVHKDLRYLVRSSSRYAMRFSTFSINGLSFQTTNRDNELKTQNSGVFLMSSTLCVASTSDANVRNADLSYYGKLEDIIELNYNGRFRVTLFKCKSADTTRERNYRKDSWGFTSVNFSRVIHSGDREEDDPYIEASQARMVYFVNNEVNKDWSVIVHLNPRDSYYMGKMKVMKHARMSHG